VRTRLTIDDLAPGGEGVGRSGSRPVFVPWTAPGDVVVADVPDGDGAAHARLVALEVPGTVRGVPPCRHFGVELEGERQRTAPPLAPVAAAGSPAPLPARVPDRECGGCEWLHVAYAAQLAAKERTVREALRRIGRLELDAYDARPIVGSPSPLRYRSRAKFHFDRGSGRLVFFRRRSHAPVRLEECHLLLPALDALREVIGPALVGAGLAPEEVALEWSERERRGAALLRLGAVTPAIRARAAALLVAVPSLAGAVLLAPGASPVLAGDPVLRHARDPLAPGAGLQRSRPDVFAQANRGANALLVRAALDLLAPDGEDVLELYCGSGNFTGPLAARARTVAAVEEQGPALQLARADLEGARNVRFFARDALELASALARDAGAPRFGAVLLDPPREGAKGIGAALRALGARRAVYVSCDPATFARDLRGCIEAGYRVAAVQAVDMFPQTHHVEAVALVERRDGAAPP
jgi:23S rRNA (uracil1939-C5)-methyltransferase